MTRKITPIKGKCLICERTRHNKVPVLGYSSIKITGKDVHILECVLCEAVWTAGTKEDVMMQGAR